MLNIYILKVDVGIGVCIGYSSGRNRSLFSQCDGVLCGVSSYSVLIEVSSSVYSDIVGRYQVVLGNLVRLVSSC